MNQKFALELLRAIGDSGTTEFCVCPGARNSPLVSLLLELPGFKKYFFYEERSAAFFALGRAKAHGRPVAVVTTSGTAAGELLPAAMEAHYACLPLVLLTADRPRRFRGTGAPQTAEQPGIFGVYAEKSLDLAAGEPIAIEWSRARPIHINACFEEPLLDTSAATEIAAFPRAFASPNSRAASAVEDIRSKLQEFLARSRHPLLIVSSLPREDREATARFVRELGAPAYFEAQSGLREDPSLAHLRLHGSESLLAWAEAAAYPVDAVLRIGGVPTLRLWRDLELLGGKIPVLSISREPFSGLSFAEVLSIPPKEILNSAKKIQSDPSRLLRGDHDRNEKLQTLLDSEPRSEASLFRALSRGIPASSRIYVGNSLPIREWDLAATHTPRGFELGASRGLNGIDGQVSTFLGFADPSVENWAILGDLTTLYDLPGPWILPQLSIRASLVVINNQGGKIFSRMFGPAEFQNRHAIEFSAWARLWNLPYENWAEVPSDLSTSTSRIIELNPDEAASTRFWKEYERISRP